jgi:predicted MFS family arabinose efflux permease
MSAPGSTGHRTGVMSPAPVQQIDPLRHRAWVLAILVVVYTFNFIDRQIIGILAVPIRADLGLSDTELGLMGGLAFALFYTALGIPIAVLADRSSRTWIMTLALTVWSFMTAVCGLAQGFWQLFLARLGVGIGEAGGVAPAYSLISDLYPPGQRARALSAYSFGIPLGSALGIVLGGWIATRIDWRTAFFIVGGAGLLLVPIFRLTVREPQRARFDAGPRPTRVSLSDVLKVIRRKPAFFGLSLGAACSSMMGYGLFFWLPSFFVRSFGIRLLDASLFYGAIILVGGLAGIWLGGTLADRFGESRKAAYAVIPAVAFLATVPFYAMGILSHSLVLSFFVLLVPTALGLAWLGPVLAAVQHLVPPNMRATASAVFLFINNLVGIGAGTALIGWISDTLRAQYGEDSLRYSVLAGTGFYLLAAAFFFWSARRLEREWHRPEQAGPGGV